MQGGIPGHVRVGLALLAGLVVLAVVGYASLYRLDVRPRLSFAPGFALTADDGTRLTSEDLRGHVVLYTFAPARPEPQRNPLPVMHAVQAQLDGEDTGAIPVRLVTVVLDTPPPRLPRLVAEAGADTARWRFATGTPEGLRQAVSEGFGVWYEVQQDGTVDFDPVFVVVDGLGIVRARYRLGLPAPEALLADLRSVVREAQAASGTLSLAYQAAHLFSCYSPTPS